MYTNGGSVTNMYVPPYRYVYVYVYIQHAHLHPLFVSSLAVHCGQAHDMNQDVLIHPVH